MKNPFSTTHTEFFTRRNPGGGAEQRHEPRSAADCVVRVCGLDSSLSANRFIEARATDVSSHGLQLKVDFIFANQPVQVSLPNRTVSGVVRYCVADGDDFRLGVRLDHPALQ